MLSNIAKTYFSLNNNEFAKKFSKKSLHIRSSASAHKLLSNIYLKEEKFSEAWEHFDGRLIEDNFIDKNSSYNKIKDKLLNRKQIDPKKQLLIIREQGVGDEILYGTMYKDVLEKFDNTLIETDDRLLELFVGSFSTNTEQSSKNLVFLIMKKILKILIRFYTLEV